MDRLYVHYKRELIVGDEIVGDFPFFLWFVRREQGCREKAEGRDADYHCVERRIESSLRDSVFRSYCAY
jgi:hypothetical protein